jgi:hypothetical protein
VVELVINDIGVVDGSVDVADGGCVGVVRNDVADSKVGRGSESTVLGGSVDIPVSFSRHESS